MKTRFHDIRYDVKSLVLNDFHGILLTGILYSIIFLIYSQENFMDVVLIDTTGNKDSIINQQLFIKGHAIWEDDVPYKEKSVS